ASLFAEIARGLPSSPRSVSARKLFDGMAAYRNQIIGHGSTRAAEFYDDAAARLLAALEAAWGLGLFAPKEARLRFIRAVRVDPSGRRLGRVLDLSADTPLIEDARGTAVPDGALPARLYLRTGDAWGPLHPWLLFEPHELRERVLFFNGRARASQYLDYVGGE